MNNRNRPSERREVEPISADDVRPRWYSLSRFPYSIAHAVADDGHSGRGAPQAQARVLVAARLTERKKSSKLAFRPASGAAAVSAVSRNTWLRVSGPH